MSITLTHKKTVIVEESETILHHEMLERIHATILAYGPHHFDMRTWATIRGEDGMENMELSDLANSTIDLGHCGYTGCFAGHATTWMRNNGLLELIQYSYDDNDLRYRVDQSILQRLMGVTYGSFSSNAGNGDWHPVTYAAYRADLEIGVNGATYTTTQWGMDEEVTRDVTADMIQDDSGYGVLMVTQEDGDTIEWEHFREDLNQHAEWVGILTYLRWVITISKALYDGDGAPGYVSDRDIHLVQNSPAFKSYNDEQEELRVAQEAERHAELYGDDDDDTE